MNKEEKKQLVKELRESFDKAQAVIFTDYKGMTVAELSELRRLFRDSNLQYRIVKNTMAKIASRDTLISIANESFKGPVGLAISYDDPVLTVRKVLEYSKKNEKLKIDIGIIEGTLCTSNDLKVLAELPPKNMLLSMFAGGLKAPLNKIAYALNATLTKLVCLMNALKTKKGS